MNEYEHGCRVMIPNFDGGDATVLTFTGSFDKRKLRRMLRKCLTGVSDKRILDALIKHCTQRLVPVSTQQMIEAMEATDDEEVEALSSGPCTEPPAGETGS